VAIVMHCNLRPSDVAPVVSRFAYMYQSRPINLQGVKNTKLGIFKGNCGRTSKPDFSLFDHP